MQAAVAGRGCLRGTFMRTAILSVLWAVISIAAPPQDPSKPVTEQPRSQQKPTDPPLSVLCAPGTTIQLGVAYNSSVVASGGTRSTQDRQRRVRGFLLAPRLLSDRFRRILWRCGDRNDRP